MCSATEQVQYKEWEQKYYTFKHTLTTKNGSVQQKLFPFVPK